MTTRGCSRNTQRHNIRNQYKKVIYKCREINSKTEKDTQINYKKTQNNNEIKKLLQSDRMTKESCKTTKKRYKTTIKRLKRATETQNGQKKKHKFKRKTITKRQ